MNRDRYDLRMKTKNDCRLSQYPLRVFLGKTALQNGFTKLKMALQKLLNCDVGV